jgi:DnaJ-class molecular chaperone
VTSRSGMGREVHFCTGRGLCADAAIRDQKARQRLGRGYYAHRPRTSELLVRKLSPRPTSDPDNDMSCLYCQFVLPSDAERCPDCGHLVPNETDSRAEPRVGGTFSETRVIECARCRGTGKLALFGSCRSCQGKGKLSVAIPPGRQLLRCARCHGRGSRVNRECRACKGAGQLVG